MAEYSVVGKPLPRVEAVGKVTGARRYSADVLLPGMLWGKVLRSPYPHARILRVDASRARALPGVHAVVTSQDVPDRLIGRRLVDIPLLARDRVRYIGDRVAAVAAEDPDTAERALGLIEVEYEELPAVFDPFEAMQPGAPLLHPDLGSYRNLPRLVDIPNVHSRVEWKKGDVAAGFAEADLVFDDRFTTPMIHQAYIEPHACVVEVGKDGLTRVWHTGKQPFQTRVWLAEAVGLPEEQVLVLPVCIGGDFGGKGFLIDEPLAYFLARATGRPVKMVMTYAEELEAGVPRNAAVLVLRTGVKRDGRLVAREAMVCLNGGAYAGHKPQPTLNLMGITHAVGSYRIPHVRVESRCVYTNQVPCGHARCPGEVQATFAGESQMDMIAHRLGMDPLELRRLNALHDGDESPLGARYASVRQGEVLERVAEAAGWGTPRPGPNVGRGIALASREVGFGKSGAVVRLLEDGRIHVLTGVPDVGTGAHTIVGQVVAEALSVPLDQVLVEQGDTASVPYDSGSGGARVTNMAGHAALRAATRLGQHLLDLAAELYGWPEGAARLEQGALVPSAGVANPIPLREFAPRALRASGGKIEEREVLELAGKGGLGFSAHVVEVEVDPETGQVRVRRITAVHDVGRVLNPLSGLSQVEGGAIFGLGHALMEEMRIEDGRIGTLSFGEYKLPSSQDIPEFRAILIEDDPGPVPFGGKGMGEVSTGVVAPAIANAIFDAVGVRVTDLPLSAERVQRALAKKRTTT